jgi:hypothetical protein
MSTKALQMRVDELEKLVSSLTTKISALEANKDAATEPTKKEIKGLKKDGTPRKKRAPCGYMLFSNEQRSAIREQLLTESNGEKVQPGAVVKKLAEMWNALDEDEKEPYNSKAKSMIDSDGE